MTLEAIKYSNGKLEILDQLLLPEESKYVKVVNVEDGWQAIRKMQVRGAPAIAITGCLSLAVDIKDKEYEDKITFQKELQDKLHYLVSSRPTAVNMKMAAEELIKLSNKLLHNNDVDVTTMKLKIISQIEYMLAKDIADNKNIGDFGAKEILSNSLEGSSVQILTHCNTGSLATAGYGTALGVIRSLHKDNRLEHVYCTETRPYNQGARLTAYELVYEKMPATLITDSMVAALFKHRTIAAVVVGADTVAANGDTANKIGTYQIAVVAKHHSVPFYIAAPFTSIDMKIPNGSAIKIEERPEREMTHIGSQRIAANGISCWNPAFDVTPADLITGIITEKGVYKTEELKNHLDQSWINI